MQGGGDYLGDAFYDVAGTTAALPFAAFAQQALNKFRCWQTSSGCSCGRRSCLVRWRYFLSIRRAVRLANPTSITVAACAIYPNWPEFADSVREEIVQQTRRLSPHPSLVLWCGVRACTVPLCLSRSQSRAVCAEQRGGTGLKHGASGRLGAVPLSRLYKQQPQHLPSPPARPLTRRWCCGRRCHPGHAQERDQHNQRPAVALLAIQRLPEQVELPYRRDAWGRPSLCVLRRLH